MKKIIKELKSDPVYREGQVVAMLERMDEKFDLMFESQVALRDELSEFKAETKNNFSVALEYLSKIDDDLADIRKELEKRKKTEVVDKNWMKKIEDRLAKAEEQIRKQKILATK